MFGRAKITPNFAYAIALTLLHFRRLVNLVVQRLLGCTSRC